MPPRKKPASPHPLEQALAQLSAQVSAIETAFDVADRDRDALAATIERGFDELVQLLEIHIMVQTVSMVDAWTGDPMNGWKATNYQNWLRLLKTIAQRQIARAEGRKLGPWKTEFTHLPHAPHER